MPLRASDLGGAMAKAKNAEGSADKGVGEWKKVIAAYPDRPGAAPRARSRAPHRAVVGSARRRAEGRRSEGGADAGGEGGSLPRARRYVRQAQQRQPSHLVADAGDPSRPVAARRVRQARRALREQEALARSRQDLEREGRAHAGRRRQGRHLSPGREPLPRAVLEPGRSDQGVREGPRARSEQPRKQPSTCSRSTRSVATGRS